MLVLIALLIAISVIVVIVSFKKNKETVASMTVETITKSEALIDFDFITCDGWEALKQEERVKLIEKEIELTKKLQNEAQISRRGNIVFIEI